MLGVSGFLALLPRVASAQGDGLVIRRLRFEGNRSIETLALEAAIATTKSSVFARNPLVSWLGLGEKRRLNEREFRRDVARIRLFYQISGFLEVQVDTVVVRTDQDVYITFKITEGEPIRVRSLTVEGLDSLPPRERERVVEDLPLRVGMPYNRYLLLAAADTIQIRLWNRGYPTAAMLLDRRDVDRANHTAVLELSADLGAPAVIGSIKVEGTSAVDSSFTRSLLAARPGRMFRYADLYQSQLNLYQSGLFRYATVGIDTTRFMIGDSEVPLLVRVQEGPLFRARSSLGVATNDCFRATAGWTARNVGRKGRQFDVFGKVSKLGVSTEPLASTICSGLEVDTIGSRQVNYGLTVSLRRPAFLSPANALTGSVFAERRSEFSVYLRDDVGTSITFHRETGRGIPITLSYRLSYGATRASPVSFCHFFLACRAGDVDQLRQRRINASLTANVSRQRVNNLLDPTRGSVVSLEGTFSSPVIGSTRFSQFTRLLAEGVSYRPLGSDVVVAGRLKGGLIFAPALRLGGGTANFVPPEHRFYAGGSNDVRGFDRNQLGPVVYVTDSANLNSDSTVADENKVSVAPTGGNMLAIGNLELRLPSPIFASRLRWALFVDAGAVWERGGSFGSAALLRVTPGLGFRFVTPLGPMRVDMAYSAYKLPRGALYLARGGDLTLLRNDYQRRSESQFPFNFQLSIGQAF